MFPGSRSSERAKRDRLLRPGAAPPPDVRKVSDFPWRLDISPRHDGGPANVGQTILSAPQAASTGHLGREMNQSHDPLSRSDSSTSRFGSDLQCEAMKRSFQQRLTWLPSGSQKGRQDCLPHLSENVQTPAQASACSGGALLGFQMCLDRVWAPLYLIAKRRVNGRRREDRGLRIGR